MSKIKFYITDVFGKEKYTGNQLATFINCIHLETFEMQAIAREINFSETTFITSNMKEDNGGYNVRIFTPATEISFAGHPALGTAYIIRKYFENEKCNSINLNLKVGQIPVNIEDGIFYMQQNQPVFGNPIDLYLVAKSLNIQVKDIDEKYPVQFVSTGLEFLIVSVKSLKILKSLTVNLEYHKQLMKQANTKGIYVFCEEGYNDSQKLSSRMFAPVLGIQEDPATGSATGCLAAYLLKNNYFSLKEIRLKVGQGYEINRPSELFIKASLNNEIYKIVIGGKVFEIAEGFWK